jgi:hypothetical protein
LREVYICFVWGGKSLAFACDIRAPFRIEDCKPEHSIHTRCHDLRDFSSLAGIREPLTSEKKCLAVQSLGLMRDSLTACNFLQFSAISQSGTLNAFQELENKLTGGYDQCSRPKHIHCHPASYLNRNFCKPIAMLVLFSH